LLSVLSVSALALPGGNAATTVPGCAGTVSTLGGKGVGVATTTDAGGATGTVGAGTTSATGGNGVGAATTTGGGGTASMLGGNGAGVATTTGGGATLMTGGGPNGSGTFNTDAVTVWGTTGGLTCGRDKLASTWPGLTLADLTGALVMSALNPVCCTKL
jgi:hypothetical protein